MAPSAPVKRQTPLSTYFAPRGEQPSNDRSSFVVTEDGIDNVQAPEGVSAISPVVPAKRSRSEIPDTESEGEDLLELAKRGGGF